MGNYNLFTTFVSTMDNEYLVNNAKTWVKRNNGPDEVIRIILDLENRDAVFVIIYTQPTIISLIILDGYYLMRKDTGYTMAGY